MAVATRERVNKDQRVKFQVRVHSTGYTQTLPNREDAVHRAKILCRQTRGDYVYVERIQGDKRTILEAWGSVR